MYFWYVPWTIISIQVNFVNFMVNTVLSVDLKILYIIHNTFINYILEYINSITYYSLQVIHSYSSFSNENNGAKIFLIASTKTHRRFSLRGEGCSIKNFLNNKTSLCISEELFHRLNTIGIHFKPEKKLCSLHIFIQHTGETFVKSLHSDVLTYRVLLCWKVL